MVTQHHIMDTKDIRRYRKGSEPKNKVCPKKTAAKEPVNNTSSMSFENGWNNRTARFYPMKTPTIANTKAIAIKAPPKIDGKRLKDDLRIGT